MYFQILEAEWIAAQVLARSLAAFSGTSGSRVGGAIPPALMKKESADRKQIELIHARPLVALVFLGLLGSFFLFALADWFPWLLR